MPILVILKMASDLASFQGEGLITEHAMSGISAFEKSRDVCNSSAIRGKRTSGEQANAVEKNPD